MIDKILKTCWKYLVLFYRTAGLFFIALFFYKAVQCFNNNDFNNVFLNFIGMYAGLTIFTLGEE